VVSSPDEVIVLFNLRNTSSSTMAVGSTQPLTEMEAGDLPEGKRWLARKADNFAAICEDCLENVEASTCHNPMGLHGLLQG
jgi:hypothetical protein